MINYCLSIQQTPWDEINSLLQQYEKQYHYFEFWLDLLPPVSLSQLHQLAQTWGSRLLFLYRRPQLQPIQTPYNARIKILHHLASTESLIDLDWSTQQHEYHEIIQSDPSFRPLLSYHNYSTTPPLKTLQQLTCEMRQKNAAICKIATFCQTPHDALRLLELQQILLQQNQPHIVLGMGKYGTITRIYGTLWGNQMLFAPPPEFPPTAPGQLSYEQTQRIFSQLTPSDSSIPHTQT